jgi:hypothetical protein
MHHHHHHHHRRQRCRHRRPRRRIARPSGEHESVSWLGVILSVERVPSVLEKGGCSGEMVY